jgi:hypothetical protein
MNEEVPMLMRAIDGIVSRRELIALAVIAAAGAAAPAHGQFLTVNLSEPVLDKWMYSFNTRPPEQQTEASVFSPLLSPFQSSFDNRDSQFVVGFDTAAGIAPGQALSRYRVRSATITVRNSRGAVWQYDATYDGFNTYLPTDPAFVADADLGRAIEMHIVGYRNGFTQANFGQLSQINPPPNFPSRSQRNAFAAVYNPDGTIRDASNNVEERFDARPIAVGSALPTPDQKDAAGNPTPNVVVNPGDLVPINTDFQFAIDLTNPDALRYLRQSLASGRLNVAISSLVITNQNGTNVPAFYTRAFQVALPDPAALPARLNLVACVGAPADWNCDGVLTVNDIFDFLADWFGSSAGLGDFNQDGVTDVRDVFDLLAAWFAG